MRNKILSTMLLVLSLIYLYFNNKYLNNLVSYIIYPVIIIEHRVFQPFINAIQLFSVSFYEKKDLVNQINSLKDENLYLLAKNVKLQSISNFYNDIKELVEFASKYEPNKFIVCQILAKHFEGQHYFFIDGGINKNIEPDMIVLYKNCIVGKISHVYPYYSKVVLITDVSSKISAYCNNVNSIHEGNGDIKSTFLTFVDHLQRINVGDMVISSGQGLLFPQGYALGIVKEVQADTGFYLKIKVEPCIDLLSLKYCLVLKKN